LNAIADELMVHAEAIVELADLETALGHDRLLDELVRAIAQLKFYGEVAVEGSYLGLTIDDATTTSPALVKVNRPVGPVAVFGASNFPFVFGVLGHDTASAIAAGCPVLAKAHEAHVGLSLYLKEIAFTALNREQAPKGVFDLVIGRDAGAELVRASEIAAVAFTGSQSGGLALWRIANDRDVPIPVYAEMGTVNPVIVTPAGAKDLKSIADGFVACYTNRSGQYCTKPGILFAPAGSEAVQLVAKSLQAAAPVPVMLTQAIASSVRSGLGNLVRGGARTVLELPSSAEAFAAPAALLEIPISAVTAGSPALEECFGAVALVCEYTSLEELNDALQQMQPSLVAAVFAASTEPDTDVPGILEILNLHVGRIVMNGWTTGAMQSWAQHHGGPWPATSNSAATSIGAAALDRFVRPIVFQSMRDEWLLPEASADNPWNLPRRVNGTIESAHATSPEPL
jgi:NADP-dependent aldehyde dehydrogenase